MKCPQCLDDALHATCDKDTRRVLHKKLSIVCNTWPLGTGGDTCTDICVCGHPWLETAGEDYCLWRAGETDVERQERRNYPTVEDWLIINNRGPLSERRGRWSVIKSSRRS